MTLQYDANGNLTSDSTGRQFTWNAQDQLTKVQFPTLSALMGYDPLGRRTTFSKGATSKTFFYLGQSMLSDGTARFLQGTGIDQPLQVETSLDRSSYLQDHLGSTSQLVDTLNGSRRARYDYTSYGQLEGDDRNPMPSNPFTYTGREEDGTGLLYYRARYYDPELEVFISQDPLGDAQRYVGGNPLSFIDPLGLRDVAFGNGYYAIPDPMSGIGHWKTDKIAGSYAPNGTPVARTGKGLEGFFNSLDTGEEVGIHAHGNAQILSAHFADDAPPVYITRDPINSLKYFQPLLNKKPSAVYLYACDTGSSNEDGSPSFAQALSSYLGDIPLYAPPTLQRGKGGIFNKYINGKQVGTAFKPW